MRSHRALLLTVFALACSNNNGTADSPKTRNDSSPKASTMPAQIEDPEPVALPDVSDETRAAVARSMSEFGIAYYDHAAADPGNVVFSPASISLAFAMTYAGARGETAREMAQTLKFSTEGQELYTGFTKVIESWNDQDEVQLAVANRLFGEETFEFKQEFIDLTTKYFRAPLQQMSFKQDPAGARQRINAWVEDKTRDKIRDLLPQNAITADTRLVLTNAIYFKGDWSRPFEKEATRPETFRAPDGTLQVQMMIQRERLQYAYDPDASVKVLQMSYQGGELAMMFVLPDEDEGFSKLEESLSVQKLQAWDTALIRREVDVHLPKFRIEPPSAVSLTESLARMGMTLAFDGQRADFSGMAEPPPPLYISDAFHKAFIEVNEKGTEAAAATAVVMAEAAAAMPDEQPVEFRADHPFLFFLRDRQTGAILFMGRVVRPELGD